MLKKARKIFVRTILILVGVMLLSLILLNTPPVQRFIANKVVNTLSDKLQTKVSLDGVNVDLLYRLQLNGLLVRDKQNDTLLYSGKAKVRITDWFFFHSKPVI